MVDRPGVEEGTVGTDLEMWVVHGGQEYTLSGRVDAHKHDKSHTSQSPTVRIKGELTDYDAPSLTQLGQTVEVRVANRGGSERFEADRKKRIGSNPVQLVATRGEPPANQFTNFERVWKIIERAYEDNHP